MKDRGSLLALLDSHHCEDDREQFAVEAAKEFIKNCDAPFSRDNAVGHVTASAWIVDSALKKVLLHHHRKYGRWLQLGGHVEDGETVIEAAMREAMEESGIASLSLLGGGVFDVDVHGVPGPGGDHDHYHFDIRFLLMAESSEFAVSEESDALAWLTLDEARGVTSEISLLRMINKTEGMVSSG